MNRAASWFLGFAEGGGAILAVAVILLLLAACADIDPDTAEDNRRLEQCRLLHGQEWCHKQDAGGQANYHKPNFGK